MTIINSIANLLRCDIFHANLHVREDNLSMWRVGALRVIYKEWTAWTCKVENKAVCKWVFCVCRLFLLWAQISSRSKASNRTLWDMPRLPVPLTDTPLSQNNRHVSFLPFGFRQTLQRFQTHQASYVRAILSKSTTDITRFIPTEPAHLSQLIMRWNLSLMDCRTGTRCDSCTVWMEIFSYAHTVLSLLWARESWTQQMKRLSIWAHCVN